MNLRRVCAVHAYASLPPEIDRLRGVGGQADWIGAVAALREKYQRQIDSKLIDLADNLIAIETAILNAYPGSAWRRRCSCPCISTVKYCDGLQKRIKLRLLADV